MPALSPFSILLMVARHVPLMPVLAAAVMAVLAGLLRRPQVKGWIGEILLHLRLRWALDRQRYRLFHNLILPTSDGSTQIDHVLVSRHGIFVIETKHYGGWIFGGQHDRRWTQKFPRRSHTFQNPLRQNHKHVRALAALTGVDDRLLVSLVVFVGSCTFKTAMPDNVTRPGGCLDAIRARTDTPLSEAEVDAICARIAAGRIAPSRAANAAHARHVRALVAQKQGEQAGATRAAPAKAHHATRVEPAIPSAQSAAPAATPAATPACPRCGGALGEYTYRSGPKAGLPFSGCTRFPECGYRVEQATAGAAAASAI
ncbi:MAG TPA: NERD domain-containing protein [Telluria sp.]